MTKIEEMKALRARKNERFENVLNGYTMFEENGYFETMTQSEVECIKAEYTEQQYQAIIKVYNDLQHLKQDLETLLKNLA